jgi:hypothetical protein
MLNARSGDPSTPGRGSALLASIVLYTHSFFNPSEEGFGLAVLVLSG